MHIPTRRILCHAIGAPCGYCGAPMELPDKAPTRDHIRPRVKGGSFEDPRNRALVCEGCNRDKGDKSLVVFLVWLIDRRDPRAERVLWRMQSLIARGLVDLCGD